VLPRVSFLSDSFEYDAEDPAILRRRDGAVDYYDGEL
jgi:hypothetical protein